MSDSTPVRTNFSRMEKIKPNVRPSTVRRKKVVERPTYADIIFHRRNIKRSRHYFTSGHEHLGKPRNVHEEPSPFKYPSCSQMFSYIQFWKAWKHKIAKSQRTTSYKDQQSYKTLQCRDLLRRLHVDVEIEKEEEKKHKDLDKITAITNIDPNYFKQLTGRAVKEKFLLNQYIDDTRDVLRTRLLTAQVQDICIHIDQQFDEEQKRLNKITQRYQKYVDGFEHFLSKDHSSSMDILEQSGNEVKRTNTISEKRNQLSKAVGQVRLDVYSWEDDWRMVKMCQEFLFRVSPMFWRMEHDRIFRSYSGENICVSSSDIFGRYKRHTEQTESLDSLIKMFEEDISEAISTELYFEDPFDLIRVFRAMETQNLNALIHLESLAGPMADMIASVAETEDQIKHEFGEILVGIEELEKSIFTMEDRATNLEEYANYLLRGVFRELVCSEEVLYMYIFIEDTYENCIATNDANLGTFTLMKLIEKTHEALNLELDTLPHDVVTQCERQGFKQETRAMKEAEDAAKKFELMLQLLESLKRMMESPITKTRPLMWRSEPIHEKTKSVTVTPEPTQEELCYLTYFTNYCKQDDYATYRSRFPQDFEFTFRIKQEDVQDEPRERFFSQ